MKEFDLQFPEAAFPTESERSVQRKVWLELSEESQRLCAVRVQAMQAFEHGASWTDAAVPIGLGKTAFYALVKRWQEDRSLQSLLPRRSGPKTRITKNARANLFDAAIETARSFPDWSRKKTIEFLQTRMPEAPSRATLGPIVDQARLEAEREGLVFGQKIVVADSPAVMRIYEQKAEGEEEAIVRHVAAVVDLASTTVLGLGVAIGARAAKRAAFDDALRAVDRLRNEAPDDQGVVFEVNLHDGDPVDTMKAVNTLKSSKFRIDPRPDSARIRPNRLAGILGAGLDEVEFRSRAELTDEGEKRDRMTRLMEAHLREQLTLLSDTGMAFPRASASAQEMRYGLLFIRDAI